VIAQSVVLAANVPFPPSVEDFYPEPIIHGAGPWFTKLVLFIWIVVAAIIVYFLVAYRDPQLVPTKRQWLAESIYGFGRDGIAKEMIGAKDGPRFAPYLTTLFCFILLGNLLSIIPFFQISPNSHIAFPAVLAVISYITFIWVGVQRHGLRFFKDALIPPAPWFMLPLLIPIELFSTFIARPFTLALRLFANMFAGHVILLVFTLGGFVLLGSSSILLKPLSLLSWAMAIALTGLELLVAVLQAYVFTVLTASYIQGALAEGH
jgi:F-type H+-transporting ATPase subunit a